MYRYTCISVHHAVTRGAFGQYGQLSLFQIAEFQIAEFIKRGVVGVRWVCVVPGVG